MSGIDRATGLFIEGFPHVVMCLFTLFSTRIGSRERRRTVGSNVPRLFGENIDEPTISRYMLAICVAVKLWEKRFKIVRIDILRDDNQPEQLRGGRFSFAIRGQYVPRAYLGDNTIDPKMRTLYVGQGISGGTVVI